MANPKNSFLDRYGILPTIILLRLKVVKRLFLIFLFEFVFVINIYTSFVPVIGCVFSEFGWNSYLRWWWVFVIMHYAHMSSSGASFIKIRWTLIISLLSLRSFSFIYIYKAYNVKYKSCKTHLSFYIVL